MPSEPNLRVLERAFHLGQPYGYGHLPVPPSIRPLGAEPKAVSRPQLIQGSPEGGGSRTDRARDVLDLIDLWDKFKETFKEVPGLWRSLLGILATPLRWLRWIFGLRGAWVVLGVAVILLGLFFLSVPLMTSCRGRDARRSEGEQLMGSARDFCRVQYSKTGNATDAERALRAKIEDFQGEYYCVEAQLVCVDENRARLYTYPTNREDGFGYMEFAWSSGNSRISWDEPLRRSKK